MSSPPGDNEPQEATLGSIANQLDGLTDLFRRRLLEDRGRQATIEDLQARLTTAERAASATAVKPLVESLSLVIDRLEGTEPSPALNTSIGSELEYILEAVIGVSTIAACVDEPVDRLRHEVVSASGEGPILLVDELMRPGYEKDGVVLRPAQVAVKRVVPETDHPTGTSE